jgi:hypothetical protein
MQEENWSAGHVAHGTQRQRKRLWFSKPERKRSPSNPKLRCKYTIKQNIKEINSEDVEWVQK